MPIWVDVDLPYPHKLVYPCKISPWGFHGPRNLTEVDDYEVEVRHDGVPVAQMSRPESVDLEIAGCMSGFGFESLRSRFPLHLAYRLGPGVYSIRLTGSYKSEVFARSAWTEFEVRVCPAEVMKRWRHSMAQRIESAQAGDLIRDAIPSLLAWPDDHALAALLPVYSRWLGKRRLVNLQVFVYGFVRDSLLAFDDDVLRRVVPRTTLIEWCPPQGYCRSGVRRPQ
jgi:hypothetical protein